MAQATTIAGGAPTQASAQVSADQNTIIGNGTPQNPLRTGSGGSGLRAYPASGFYPGPLLPGRPVYPSSLILAFADASARATACLTGLVVDGPNDDNVWVQGSGDVVLTTAQWDAICGTSGGLTAGVQYYVSVTGGEITAGPPAGGNWSALVGIAIDATTMQLQLSGAHLV